MPPVKKASVLTLRISDEEQDELRRAAEQRNQSVSEYVRSVVRGDIANLAATGPTVSETPTTRSAAPATRSAWVTGGSGTHTLVGSTLIVNASGRIG